jgi:hypothetical protein
MDKQHYPGFYVYERNTPGSTPVLKELLQLSKTVAAGKCSGFSFVHGNSSLIPNLTLWENLQLSTPQDLWDDFVRENNPIISSLIPLLKEPYKKASVSSQWECFLVSLMKGILEPTSQLLVEMNEDSFPPFLMKTIKFSLMKSSHKKVIYLSTVAPSLWLDCAHHLVKKNGYTFELKQMDHELIKRHWAA